LRHSAVTFFIWWNAKKDVKAMSFRNLVDVMVGERLKTGRLEKNLRLEDFARMVGVSAAQVEDWEAGNSRVPSRHLMEIIKRLDLTVDYLFSPPKTQMIRTRKDYDRVSSEEAVSLLRAFVQIEDPRRRAQIVEYVEALAKGGSPPPPIPFASLGIDSEPFDE
jgi:transcriptional regulator with XRE-family HTH domain